MADSEWQEAVPLYQSSDWVTCGCPIAARDGHDFPRLIDERVPGVAAVIDDVIEGFENSVRQPILPHELPDIFLAVEFGRAASALSGAEPVETLLLLVAERGVKLLERGLHGSHRAQRLPKGLPHRRLIDDADTRDFRPLLGACADGHAAAPPSSVMNSRRFIREPRWPGRPIHPTRKRRAMPPSSD